MHRNLFVFAALLATLGASLQAHAATSSTSCTAGNPNTTSFAETTPSSAFTDSGNGTVTHTLTGLMWKRCAEGQTWNGSTCINSATSFTWANALIQANTSFAGHTDWRLPNKKELESIVEFCGYEPSINQTEFPATAASVFWSGSSIPLSVSAWVVDFRDGFTNSFGKSLSFPSVRLVRGGQSFASFDAQAIPPAAPTAPTAIPTLSEWGVILLAGLLGLFGLGVMRRRARVVQ